MTAPHDSSLAFLDGPGEVATLMRERDWNTTPLGPPSGWPTSLRTILQVMLSSRYAMWMGWGPELTFFCNDAYRPTLGVKTGWLGARSDRVWEEIWPDVGPRIDHVMRTGEATWDEALMLVLERSGFPEETYHTFSYSPVADDTGAINGMLCVVSEATQGVLGERRLHVLRDLALRIAQSRSHAQLWAAVKACLATDSRDLPLASAYTFDNDGTSHQTLVAGIARGSPRVVPDWPLQALRDGATEMLVADATGLRSTAWNKTSPQALLVPITVQGHRTPIGVFVAGLNPFRMLDAEYRGFIDLFVGQISAGLTAVDAFEAERRRAESLAVLDLAKTAFFSNVSHEFRTPLTLMLGPLEDALAEVDQAPQQRERLLVAHRNSLRLLRLVNALLDFSRIESGRAQATFRPTDLAALTSDLASSFRSATDKAGLRLTVDCPALDEAVFVDRDMWEKIVLNLLSNAFKFTLEGTIEVSLRATGDGTVRLVVRDSGTGIPQSELPHVFERFHRVEGARGRSFEGSGIGLSLVQELVRLHRGTIRVESTVDVGTTFVVELQRGAGHLDPDRVMEASDVSAVHGRGQAFVEEALRWLPDEERRSDESMPVSTDVPFDAPARHRVLLADDNADLRDYIARLLTERGYAVDAVADGIAALDRIREQKPDLLVTDVMMPRLDGFGLLATIRAEASLLDLPVIMLSARAGEEARIEGLAAGADDYLIKPFSARELLARVSGTIGMATLRRDAAEAIRATEARSAAVLEGMAEGFVLLDDGLQVRLANAEALRQAGSERADLVGRSYFDAWPHVGGPEQTTALRRALADRVAVTVEEDRTAADGRVAHVEVRAYPSSEGLAIFRRDITDRKRAENALRDLNENLEQQVDQRTRERDRTWNNAQDLLIVLDRRGICQAANPAWFAVLGRRPDTLVGRLILDFLHPDDLPLSTQALERAGSTAIAPVVNRYRHRDGSYRWISWIASPEDDLIYASGRNVTAETEAAAELEHAQELLRQSQKMEAVGQLTGGLAHDFNNLLTGISGSLELLQMRIGRGQVNDLDRYVNAAQGAARRAAALTHRLLAFSRRQTLDPKPTDVNRLIADLEDLVRRTVGGTIEIDVIGAAGLWPVLVDQNQLENALLNLCINGRDAMAQGGRLTIETANRLLDERSAKERDLVPGAYLSVCVTDNGSGMTAAVRERAFDPFFTTKPIGSGTGLGLSMVYGFARQSGGAVRIYSEVDRGTTICIYLPRHVGSDPGVAVENVAASPASDAAGHERIVLVVDDEPTVRMLVVEVLSSMGCSTIEAPDGASALAILQSAARIDLLITDVGLPGGLNGRQVADAARAIRPALRVLFITGYAENAVVGNGYLDHGMQVLTKPFAMDALGRRVTELLSDRSPSARTAA